MSTVIADEPWARVSAAIAARMERLHISMADAERGGISYKSMVRYLAGAPIKRVDKRRQLTALMRWSPDSIERLLRGEEPVTLPGSDDLETGPPSMTVEMARQLAELTERVAELGGEVERLKRSVRRGASGSSAVSP